MAKLLLEDTWSFKPDRTRLTEAKVGKLNSTTIPGTLSQCDVENGNKRRYARAVWETNLKEGSRLMDLISRRAAWGTLEHPASGVVDLQSEISHAVTNVKLQEDGTLTGEITIFDDLPHGKRIRTLIEFGYDPLVSSRGYGSVVRNADGIDEVQTDYVCEGWDIVATPSFTKAQLTPSRTTESTAKPNLSPAGQPAVLENQGAAPVGQPSTTKVTVKKTMDINETRQSVATLRSVDVLTASPRVVTESFAQVVALRRSLSEVRATTPALAYDCDTLSEELISFEKKWTESIQAIREEVGKLRADREKLVVVAEQLSKTARLYRTKLSETVKKSNATATLFETATQRGRGWHQVATKRGEKAATLEHQAQVACAAIDMLAEKLVAAESGKDQTTTVAIALKTMAEKYHTDTAKLARKVVELQYPADYAKPEIKEKLEKAKTAEEVLKVVTEMQKPAASVTPPAPAASTPAPTTPAPAKPANESVPSTPNSGTSTNIEGITTTRMVVEQLGHQLSFEQAVGMTRRMSPSLREAQQAEAAKPAATAKA